MTISQPRTKLWYAEQVRNSLFSNHLTRDIQIDLREVMLQLDNLVNEFAKAGFFENWKLGFGKVSDLWITDFSPITITDVANQNSYFQLPSNNYVSLPNGQGVNDIFFMNDPTKVTKKYFKTIIIKNFKDVAGYRGNLAGDNQGRISCYIKNRIVYFDRPKVGTIYGQCGIRLVLRDASMLADMDVYPIPAEYENAIVSKCVDFFIKKRMRETDNVRDNVDKQPGK